MATIQLKATSRWLHNALAAAISVLLLGGAILPVAVLGLARGLEEATPATEYAWISGQNDDLQIELIRLGDGLEELQNSLFEIQDISFETRDLVGLAPRPMPQSLGNHPAFLVSGAMAGAISTTALQLDDVLRQSRVLRRSFDEIVTRMEFQADAWACLPTTPPVYGARMTSGFGLRRDPFTGRLTRHEGIDLRAPYGTPVLSCADGVVTRAGYAGGYGKLVEVDHGNGLITRYGHNSRIAVERGDRIRRGDILAYVGSTGRASAPHLHYEVRLNGIAVNPEPYILPEETLLAEQYLAE